MAKKDKPVAAPNPHNIQNRDILQRLNFLYQASVYLQSMSSSSAGDSPVARPSNLTSAPRPTVQKAKNTKATTRKENAKRRTARRTRAISTDDIARSYVRTMKQVAQKATVKMDPAVKRTLCKGCDAVLVPGLSASVRVHPSKSHGQLVTTTCHSCHSTRRIPAPPIPDDDDGDGDVGMAVDGEPSGSGMQPSKKGKKGESAAPRLPPLFERNVGHVVFRGNEQILPPRPVSSGPSA